MIRQNIKLLFRNYIDHFDLFNGATDSNETYKWRAIEQVQNVWDLAEQDLSDMIKRAFSKTYNLINNRIVSPGSGLVLLAKEEPDSVRKALEGLLAETSDADEKQENILRFVDEINDLLEKHFPGKWKYTHDVRVAITYLSLILPSQNYLFKSTEAHYFANWMGFDTDIGSGQTFKLKHYYQMCDELLAEVNACPELLAKDAERSCDWKDKSGHVLVSDLIFCFSAYPFMRTGLNEPEPRVRKSGTAALAAQRVRKAEELQKRLDQLQDEMDAVQKEIDALPAVNLTGKTVRTKLYGEVTIEKQEGNYLTINAGGKERQFALPGCITNGFLQLEDISIIERCQKEAEHLDKLEKLNKEQRLANLEFGKY